MKNLTFLLAALLLFGCESSPIRPPSAENGPEKKHDDRHTCLLPAPETKDKGDSPIFVPSPATLRGDGTGDGFVDIWDVVAVAQWLEGRRPSAPQNCDINCDGFLTQADLYAFVDYFNQNGNILNPNTESVPCQ